MLQCFALLLLFELFVCCVLPRCVVFVLLCVALICFAVFCLEWGSTGFVCVTSCFVLCYLDLRRFMFASCCFAACCSTLFCVVSSVLYWFALIRVVMFCGVRLSCLAFASFGIHFVLVCTVLFRFEFVVLLCLILSLPVFCVVCFRCITRCYMLLLRLV